MTRPEIRSFLRNGVESLKQPSTTFGFGVITDFNSKNDKIYPTVWWVTEPPTDTEIMPQTQAPFDNWNTLLVVGIIDKLDSNPETYEEIIDDCDLIAQKIMIAYNQNIEGYKLVKIQGSKRTPFVKKYADCITGVELEFTIRTISTVTNCP